jgi:hypothetical protein
MATLVFLKLLVIQAERFFLVFVTRNLEGALAREGSGFPQLLGLLQEERRFPIHQEIREKKIGIVHIFHMF